MSYVWGTQGIGFEYPTCYRTENRFLMLRGALLLVGWLVVTWIALSDPEPASGAAALLTRAERGSPTPHLVASLLMLVLAIVDLVAAARQRRLLLVPGQPASLGQEVSRQAHGTAADAGRLQRLVEAGQWPAAESRVPFAGWLRKLSGHVELAPLELQHYLGQRIAHLMLALLMAGVLTATWVPMAARPALPLAVMIYAGVAAALAARALWFTRSAPGLSALLGIAVVAAAAGLALTALGDKLPYVAKMKQLELPLATLLVFALLMLIELLALLAARAQLAGPAPVHLSKAEAAIDLVADPTRLLQEVEREMHRFWAEGVPNRRYSWELPTPDGHAAMLEESQPQPLPERADREGGEARSRPWLLALASLGVAMTLAGIVLWVLLAYHLIQNSQASWATAATAVVLVAAGGYALRIGHLLWSRTEVESLLVSIDFRAVDTRPAAAVERPMRLRARVVRLRTLFYLAADHVLGSRTLVRAQGDEASARRFVDQVRAYAERSLVEPGLAMRATAATTPPRAPGPVAAPGPAGRISPAAPAAAPARFCHACGTPLLQGARFCQNCGAAVRTG